MGILLRSFIGIPILVVIIAVAIGLYEDANDPSTIPRPDHLGSIQNRSPKNSQEFGRYTAPLTTIDYSWVSSSKLFDFFAFKHWDFKSIATKRYFIVAAIAHFNYVANVFVYVVDRENPTREIYQYDVRSPLAIGVTERAESSINGCTKFYRSDSEYIRLCYDSKQKSYRMEFNIPMHNGVQIYADSYLEYSTENDQSLALLYPVNSNRPVYTHKIAGLSSRGKIRIGNDPEENFDNGFGSIDWTLGYPARICRWKWASLSTSATVESTNKTVSIGINLSDLVYNDKSGISMEAAVWIAGRVYTLDRMIYELPAREYQTKRQWKIYSDPNTKGDIPKIDLVFEPKGSQEEHINVLLLAGDFVQIFGVYSGRIQHAGQTYVIENAFGVTENHYAKW